MRTNKTFTPRPSDIDRAWWVVDAEDLPLGRLASEVAQILRGKHKPKYSPHMDLGDFVVVINAEKIAVTGAKAEQKQYYRHSGFPGGLRSQNFERMRVDLPRAHHRAGRQGHASQGSSDARCTKLKVYAGGKHPHEAQDPQPLEFDIRKVVS